MKRMKRIGRFRLRGLYMVCVPALCFLLSLPVSAFVPYDSYTYSTATENAYIHSPAPYIPDRYVDSKVIGTPLEQPTDFAFGPEGLYIVDGKLNKIVLVDDAYRLKTEISAFDHNGQQDRFSEPEGIFIKQNGDIYVCDTGNRRIVILSKSGTLLSIIQKPDSPLLAKDYEFKPRKITVDQSGTMYVINASETAGLMKLSADGRFITYAGSNKAIVNPLLRIWKRIMSEQQKKQLVSFVPVEYNNLSMDSDGFIYTVSAATGEATPVKRLNLSGEDILARLGYVDITGDVIFEDPTEASIFVDICSAENGNYYVLDSRRSRIFTYNQEGYLLYVFGSSGDLIGNLITPSAIECRGDSLLVLDQSRAAITVYQKTEYARLITDAETSYYNGDYDQSLRQWNDVLKINAFFELGYLQLGKIYLRGGDSRKAMECFKLGNYRGDTITYMTGYNKAFTELRKVIMSDYLGLSVLVALGLVIVTMALRRYRRNAKSTHARNGEGPL